LNNTIHIETELAFTVSIASTNGLQSLVTKRYWNRWHLFLHNTTPKFASYSSVPVLRKTLIRQYPKRLDFLLWEGAATPTLSTLKMVAIQQAVSGTGSFWTYFA
jgi:hypothetical protein